MEIFIILFFCGKLEKKDEEIYLDYDWIHVLGAIDFINEYSMDKPFCIYLPLTYPHPPYAVEEPFYSMINRAKVPARYPTPNWSKKPSILKEIWDRQGLKNWPEERWNELRAVYLGMCARIDHQFGLIIEALKRRGFYDNTLILFFSDHGDFTGDYGLVEKTQNTFEDVLTRVPLVIKPPFDFTSVAGVSEVLCELIDIPATIYDFLDIDPGYDHFGKSLLPVITGSTNEHRLAVYSEGGRRLKEEQAKELESFKPDSLYFPRLSLQITDEKPYHTKATMCRTKKFKYVKRLYEIDEFYDLEKDPQELNNVIDDPSYSNEIQRHKELMLTWYQETCDVVPKNTDKRA